MKIILLLLALLSVTIQSIRVCHHNDFQARYVETDAFNRFCPASRPSDRCFSSAARLRTAFSLFKCDVRISAGDFSFGSIYWNTFDQEIAIAAYNAIGYDMAIFGIEDVTIGFNPIFETIRKTPKISWLGTNIKLPGNPQGVKLAQTIDRNNICFVSALTPKLTELYDYRSIINISEPVRSIQQSLGRCSNKRNVVAVTHLGVLNDVQLCRSVPELDLVIGGFSQSNLAWAGQYPIRVVRKDGSICYVVQAFAFGRQMGFTDLQFRDGQLFFDGYGIIPLDGKIEPNKDVERIMDSFTNRLNGRNLNGKVATLTGPIPDDCAGKECARGNLLCDALLDASENDADVCILNSDYSRGSYPSGNITKGDLLELAQFPNNKSVITISGKGLLEALENGFSADTNDPIGYGPFPQISGMRVVYDMSRPVGHRVVNVAIKHNPIVPRFTYRVITSSFLALGNYGYTWNTATRRDIKKVPIRDIVEFYLRFNSPYTPIVDGRLLNIGS